MGMLYIILPVGIIIVAIISFRIIHTKRVNQTICCSEGRFSVHGTKKRFIIQKGTRFVFVVENGQIISVKDRSAASKQIEYGGH